jgi:hypothetical protein
MSRSCHNRSLALPFHLPTPHAAAAASVTVDGVFGRVIVTSVILAIPIRMMDAPRLHGWLEFYISARTADAACHTKKPIQAKISRAPNANRLILVMTSFGLAARTDLLVAAPASKEKPDRPRSDIGPTGQCARRMVSTAMSRPRSSDLAVLGPFRPSAESEKTMLSPHALRSTRVNTSEDLQDYSPNGPSQHSLLGVAGCLSPRDSADKPGFSA